MPRNSDKITIFLSADKNLDFALANMIIGLKRYNRHLIDKIIIFSDLSGDEVEKIAAIWPGVVEFRHYDNAAFERDFRGDLSVAKNFILRFSIYTFAKFYIFDILRDARTQKAVFMDADMLCVSPLDDILSYDEDCVASYSYKQHTINFFKAIGRPEIDDRVVAFSAGFMAYDAAIFKKAPQNLTAKCFEILREHYGKTLKSYNIDEVIFAIIGGLYDFSYKDAREFNFAFIFDTVNAQKSIYGKMKSPPKLIHAAGGVKFWSYGPSFYAFNEWWVNHKIWVSQFGGDSDKITPPAVPLGLKDEGELFHFFYFHGVKIAIFEAIYAKFYDARIMCKFSQHNFGFDIENNGVKIECGYNFCTRGHGLFIELRFFGDLGRFEDGFAKNGFVPRDGGYFRAFNDGGVASRAVLAVLEILIKNGVAVSEISAVRKNLEREISALKGEINSQKFIKNSVKIGILRQKENLAKLAVFEKEKALGVKLSKLEPRVSLNLSGDLWSSGVARVRNHLAYKLGTAVIASRRSFWGVLFLSAILYFVKISHKMETEKYEKFVAKNPAKKFPPLEKYADFNAALREKNCFTYKLGEAFIKGAKSWYKGGWVRFYFEAKRLEREFKKAKNLE